MSKAATLLAAAVVLSAIGLPAGARPKKAPVVTAPPEVKPTAADWRSIAPDDLLVIDTNKGRIVVALSPAVAPASVTRIKTLARQHFYDGLTFFRVVDSFMAQTGDPKDTGEGGSVLPDLKAEFSFRRDRSTPFVPESEDGGVVTGFVGPLPVATQPDPLMGLTVDGKVPAWGLFCPGVAGIARAGSPDSGNSQFFLMRANYPKLSQQYTAFGRVMIGQAVVKSLKVGEPVDAPQDRMTQVRLASDLPAAERPVVRVLDTASAAFKAVVDRTRDEVGGEFSICDVEVPVQTDAQASASPR